VYAALAVERWADAKVRAALRVASSLGERVKSTILGIRFCLFLGKRIDLDISSLSPVALYIWMRVRSCLA